MFKMDRNGHALMMCATCIEDEEPVLRQAVTIYSGRALCPYHLSRYNGMKNKALLDSITNDAMKHLEVP